MFDRNLGAASPARGTALACLANGIAAADPRRGTGERVRVDGSTLRIGDAAHDLEAFDRVVVVGGGKAAGGVADALEATLDGRIDAGAVVTTDPGSGGRIERLRGDHPVPSEAGVEATHRVRALAAAAGERALVVAVITGGASALLAAPSEGIDLDDIRATTEALLAAGADIAEVNAVRKHLSAVKGGQLARLAAPATVVTLAVSDVVGDDPSTIGSGPTAPDETTYADALAALDRHGIDAPDAVRRRLEGGEDGGFPETPGAAEPAFERVETHIIADATTALDAARATARNRGYAACLLSSRMRGEAREVGTVHAAIAAEVAATGEPVEPPAVLLSGGETTVTVRGDGVGGPNLEFALAGAIELRDRDAAVALAGVDTDGSDGATDAAGAVVGPETVDDPARARAALADNDALPYLDARDAVLRSGATGTNVNDLRAVVVEED